MISIIVPVYNAGPFLKPLLHSICVQTYSEIELLLIDDGSTDGSAELCDQQAENDSRIRVFHKKNGGQSSARNLGLDEARGAFIAFADHDDILHPRMYETMIREISTFGANVCACQFANTPNASISELDFEQPIAAFEEVQQCELVARFFTPAWHIPVWNKLYRREVIEDLRFHSAMLGEDNLFSYRILKRCDVIPFCPTTLYFQRMHDNNFEFTGLRHMADLIAAKESILRDIQTSFPELYHDAQAKFLSECVRVFNLYERMKPEYDFQKRQVFQLMQRNSKGIFASRLPVGQKTRFLFYRIVGQRSVRGEIKF